MDCTMEEGNNKLIKNNQNPVYALSSDDDPIPQRESKRQNSENNRKHS